MPFFICPHCTEETYAAANNLDFKVKCQRCKQPMIDEKPTMPPVGTSVSQEVLHDTLVLTKPAITQFQMLRTEAQRLVDEIKTTPPVRDSAFCAHIHNDAPTRDKKVEATKLDILVVRGTNFSLANCNDPFGFQADVNGFEVPTIIRDCYMRRRGLDANKSQPTKGVVTSHMQTKSILAWTKSLNKGLEYASGNGYLFFAWCEYGIDVEATVRQFESDTLLPALPNYGTQAEVLTAATSKNRIIAAWKITRVTTTGESKEGDSFFKVEGIEDNGQVSTQLPKAILEQYKALRVAFEKKKLSDGSYRPSDFKTTLDPKNI